MALQKYQEFKLHADPNILFFGSFAAWHPGNVKTSIINDVPHFVQQEVKSIPWAQILKIA